jgi:hypothetical protein
MLNFTIMADIPEGAPVLTGIFSVLNYPAIILFDSGASHPEAGLPHIRSIDTYQ